MYACLFDYDPADLDTLTDAWEDAPRREPAVRYIERLLVTVDGSTVTVERESAGPEDTLVINRVTVATASPEAARTLAEKVERIGEWFAAYDTIKAGGAGSEVTL